MKKPRFREALEYGAGGATPSVTIKARYIHG